jgi:hypothetical protein
MTVRAVKSTDGPVPGHLQVMECNALSGGAAGTGAPVPTGQGRRCRRLNMAPWHGRPTSPPTSSSSGSGHDRGACLGTRRWKPAISTRRLCGCAASRPFTAPLEQRNGRADLLCNFTAVVAAISCSNSDRNRSNSWTIASRKGRHTGVGWCESTGRLAHGWASDSGSSRARVVWVRV